MLAVRARRVASYFFAPGIAVLLVAACTAGNLQGDGGPARDPRWQRRWRGRCPLGRKVPHRHNGDGRPDLIDLDGDGVSDGPGFDSNCDGTADGFGIDSNNDGIIDKIQNDDGSEVVSPGSGGGPGFTLDSDPPSGGTTSTGEYCQGRRG